METCCYSEIGPQSRSEMIIFDEFAEFVDFLVVHLFEIVQRDVEMLQMVRLLRKNAVKKKNRQLDICTHQGDIHTRDVANGLLVQQLSLIDVHKIVRTNILIIKIRMTVRQITLDRALGLISLNVLWV